MSAAIVVAQQQIQAHPPSGWAAVFMIVCLVVCIGIQISTLRIQKRTLDRFKDSGDAP